MNDESPRHYVLNAEPGHVNVSPELFRVAAQDFFQCFLDYRRPNNRVSVVPYFLCCRAMELAMKSVHLETMPRNKVKSKFSHNLVLLYKKLPTEKKMLLRDELAVLCEANKIYDIPRKGFEYISVLDAGQSCTTFPPLDALENLTRKVMTLAQIKMTQPHK